MTHPSRFSSQYGWQASSSKPKACNATLPLQVFSDFASPHQENTLFKSSQSMKSALMRPLGVLRAVTLAAALGAASAAFALPTITFLPTDLVDITAGQDLWVFEYAISGPLAEFESINLLFASTNFSPAITVSFSDLSLSTTVTAPISALGVDGQVLATAMVPLASTAVAAMSVQFVWTGIGSPGAQSFEVLDDQFNVLSTGTTTLAAAVPEASTAAMLFAGMMLLAPVAYRRRRR